MRGHPMPFMGGWTVDLSCGDSCSGHAYLAVDGHEGGVGVQVDVVLVVGDGLQHLSAQTHEEFEDTHKLKCSRASSSGRFNAAPSTFAQPRALKHTLGSGLPSIPSAGQPRPTFLSCASASLPSSFSVMSLWVANSTASNAHSSPASVTTVTAGWLAGAPAGARRTEAMPVEVRTSGSTAGHTEHYSSNMHAHSLMAASSCSPDTAPMHLSPG